MQFVFQIHFGLRAGGGTKLIGAREDDFADEFFHRPTFLHESNGKVIEQRLVGWQAAHVAEVVHAGHEAFAEEMMPHAVGKHARGERMLGAGHPVSQLQPAAGFGHNLRQAAAV